MVFGTFAFVATTKGEYGARRLAHRNSIKSPVKPADYSDRGILTVAALLYNQAKVTEYRDTAMKLHAQRQSVERQFDPAVESGDKQAALGALEYQTADTKRSHTKGPTAH